MKAEMEGRRLIECIKSSATIDGLFGRSRHKGWLKSTTERLKIELKWVEGEKGSPLLSLELLLTSSDSFLLHLLALD